MAGVNTFIDHDLSRSHTRIVLVRNTGVII